MGATVLVAASSGAQPQQTSTAGSRMTWDQSVVALTRLIAAEPTKAELFMGRSYAYGIKGDFVKAEADRVHFMRLDGAHQKENLKLSLRSFEKFAKNNPQNLNAQLNIGAINTALVNYVEARKNFERALKIDANSPWAHYGLGMIAIAYKDYKQALASFDRVIALRPKSAWGYNGRGSVLVLQDKHTAALADFNKSVALEPQSSLSYTGRGMAQVMSGKYAAARVDLARALTLDPLNARAYVYRGLGDLYENKTYPASVNLTVAIALDPRDAFAYYLRGVAFSQTSKYEAAVADFDQAIANDPKYAAAYRERGAAQSNLAFRDPTFKAKALASYSKSIELDAKDALAYEGRASLFDKDEGELALNDLSKVIELEPSSPEAFRQRAFAYLNMGDREKAKADFEHILVLTPENSEIKLRLAKLELDKDIAADPQNAELYAKRATIKSSDESGSLADPVSALEDFSMALKLSPENADYLGKRGAVPSNPDAIADLNRAIELNPDNARNYMRRAYIKTDNDQLLKDLTRAIELDPKNESALGMRAKAYGEREEYAKALADYNAAIQLNPKGNYYYSDRAMVYIAMGDYQAALADFNRVPATDGSIPGLKSALKILEKFQQAIKAHPNEAEGYLNRAGYLSDSRIASFRGGYFGENTLVRNDIAKAIALDPKSARAYAMRGQLVAYNLSDEANRKQVIADFSKSLQLQPKQIDLIKTRARAYLADGQFEKSVADYVAIAQWDPEPSPTIMKFDASEYESDFKKAIFYFTQAIIRNPKSAKAYLHRAIMNSEFDKEPEAVADFTQALRLDPKMTVAYLLRGMIYEGKEAEVGKALADYSTAIRLNPSFAGPYYRKAEVLLFKNPGQAVTSFNAFLKVSPGSRALVYSRRGLAYSKAKNWSKSIADFEALFKLPAVEANPTDYGLERKWLREAYVAQGSYDQAIAGYNQDLKGLSGEDAAYLLSLRGQAYFFRGDLQKAIADFNKAVEYSPRLVDAYSYRSSAYQRLGQYERAGSDAVLAKKVARSR